MKGTWNQEGETPAYDYDARVRRFPAQFAELARPEGLVRMGYSWQGTAVGDSQMTVIYGDKEETLVHGFYMRVPSVEIGTWLPQSHPEDPFAGALKLHANGFIAAREETADPIALLELIRVMNTQPSTASVDQHDVEAELFTWKDCNFLAFRSDGNVVTVASARPIEGLEFTFCMPEDGARLS